MASHYKWINGGLEINFSETLTAKDIDDVTKAVLGHENFDKMKFVICSFEHVKEHNLSILDAKMIGSLSRQSTYWNDQLHIALVQTKKLSRLIPIYLTFIKLSKWNVRSFDTELEALYWLGQERERVAV